MNSYRKWCWIIGWSTGVAFFLFSAKATGAEDDPGPEIKANPPTIQVGGITKLTWFAQGSAAFLSQAH